MSSSRDPVQHEPGTYTHDQMVALQDYCKQNAKDDHLKLAAALVTKFLASAGIPYAIMGGFSLRIRGSPRQTYDVDLACGCNMAQLMSALKGKEGYYIHVNLIS
jgi:hypothetical protein